MVTCETLLAADLGPASTGAAFTLAGSACAYRTMVAMPPSPTARQAIRARRRFCMVFLPWGFVNYNRFLALEGRRNKAQGERTREPWEPNHGSDPRVREYAHPGLYYDAPPGLRQLSFGRFPQSQSRGGVA